MKRSGVEFILYREDLDAALLGRGQTVSIRNVFIVGRPAARISRLYIVHSKSLQQSGVTIKISTATEIFKKSSLKKRFLL